MCVKTEQYGYVPGAVYEHRNNSSRNGYGYTNGFGLHAVCDMHTTCNPTCGHDTMNVVANQVDQSTKRERGLVKHFPTSVTDV